MMKKFTKKSKFSCVITTIDLVTLKVTILIQNDLSKCELLLLPPP